MPTYKFINTETNEEFTDFFGIAEMEKFLQDNEHIKPLMNGSPGLGYHYQARKPDSSFRDILKNIKKGNSKGLTRSTINTF